MKLFIFGILLIITSALIWYASKSKTKADYPDLETCTDEIEEH